MSTTPRNENIVEKLFWYASIAKKALLAPRSSYGCAFVITLYA